MTTEEVNTEQVTCRQAIAWRSQHFFPILRQAYYSTGGTQLTCCSNQQFSILSNTHKQYGSQQVQHAVRGSSCWLPVNRRLRLNNPCPNTSCSNARNRFICKLISTSIGHETSIHGTSQAKNSYKASLISRCTVESSQRLELYPLRRVV